MVNKGPLSTIFDMTNYRIGHELSTSTSELPATWVSSSQDDGLCVCVIKTRTFFRYRTNESLWVIHHSFTLSLQAQNLPFQQILPTVDFFYLLDCLTITGLDRTYHAHHFVFRFTF